MLDENILFLLTPKSKVAFAEEDYTLRQVIEKMNFYKFTAIPVLTREGKYYGTITEGDLLWLIKEKYDLNYSKAEKTPLREIPLRKVYTPIKVDTKVKDLISMAINENFVPVVDDNDYFIGIITRKSILQDILKKVQ